MLLQRVRHHEALQAVGALEGQVVVRAVLDEDVTLEVGGVTRSIVAVRAASLRA